MKKLMSVLLVCGFAAIVPSCGGSSATAPENVPENVETREYRDMQRHPENYDPAALEKAGLDPSAGTPGGQGAPGEGEAAAPAEGQ